MVWPSYCRASWPALHTDPNPGNLSCVTGGRRSALHEQLQILCVPERLGDGGRIDSGSIGDRSWCESPMPQGGRFGRGVTAYRGPPSWLELLPPKTWCSSRIFPYYRCNIRPKLNICRRKSQLLSAVCVAIAPFCLRIYPHGLTWSRGLDCVGTDRSTDRDLTLLGDLDGLVEPEARGGPRSRPWRPG
jgi:hypothetical protein